MKTVRRPPYPKWNPGYFPCSSLTPPFRFPHAVHRCPSVDSGLGQASGDDVLSHLQTYQNDDGGWERFDSDMQGAVSTISQTWVGLQWLLRTRPSDSVPLDRTMGFLSESQRDEGYWDEPPEILQYDPPPWMVPGNRANQLWLTSAVCCKLLELGREAEVRFEAAVEFLRRGWGNDGFPVYQHTHWMAVNLFGHLPEPSDLDRRIAAGCVNRLVNDLTTSNVDPLARIHRRRASG